MQPTEKQNVIQKTTKQKLTSWGVQLFIYLGIFFAISWYQQKDMLAVGNLVAQAKTQLNSG